MDERKWDGWICHPCAVKAGMKIPEGHIVSCVRATCPKCGTLADLAPESDYSDYRRDSNGKEEG